MGKQIYERQDIIHFMEETEEGIKFYTNNVLKPFFKIDDIQVIKDKNISVNDRFIIICTYTEDTYIVVIRNRTTCKRIETHGLKVSNVFDIVDRTYVDNKWVSIDIKTAIVLHCIDAINNGNY